MELISSHPLILAGLWRYENGFCSTSQYDRRERSLNCSTVLGRSGKPVGAERREELHPAQAPRRCAARGAGFTLGGGRHADAVARPVPAAPSGLSLQGLGAFAIAACLGAWLEETGWSAFAAPSRPSSSCSMRRPSMRSSTGSTCCTGSARGMQAVEAGRGSEDLVREIEQR